jgi:hypothetical protein
MGGAVGLNAAAAGAEEPTHRIRVASAGWARWTPVNLVGIGAYVAGGAVLMAANKGRLAAQRGGVGRATMWKSVLTVVSLAATAYSRVLGQRQMDAGKTPVADGTTPLPETSEDVASAQRQLKALQWAIPAHVCGLIALNALMGEQQRPTQVARGIVQRVFSKAS